MSYQKLAEELIEFFGQLKSGPIPPPNAMELSRGEIGILIYLVQHKNSASAGELSQELNLTTGRIATALKSLEKKKYVERRVDPDDGRRVIVYLTELGSQFTNNKKQEAKTHIIENLEKLTYEEAEHFTLLIKKYFSD